MLQTDLFIYERDYKRIVFLKNTQLTESNQVTWEKDVSAGKKVETYYLELCTQRIFHMIEFVCVLCIFQQGAHFFYFPSKLIFVMTWNCEKWERKKNWKDEKKPTVPTIWTGLWQ